MAFRLVGEKTKTAFQLELSSFFFPLVSVMLFMLLCLPVDVLGTRVGNRTCCTRMAVDY